MNIIFFGSSSYVVPIIEALNKNFNLVLVVTTDVHEGAVLAYCQQNKIEFAIIKHFNNLIIKKMRDLKCPIAVLTDFGLIIPTEILSLFPKGIINIHPSLLPKYRGPTPVQTAILNGEKTTGVSIMKLDEKIDHGPILTQEKEEILDADTSETLYKRLFKKGSNLLPKVIDSYLKNNLKLTVQNHKDATFTKPLTRQDGFIDLSSSKLKIEDLKLKIRAYFPWPGVWTEIRIKDKGLRIKFLPEQKIQVEGKKPVNYKDFLNGYPEITEQLRKLLEQLV